MGILNFSAGPAMLPPAVMQKAAAEFVDYKGMGFGIMEASHRGAEFSAVIEGAEQRIRELMGIPDNYSVLFLQGGASTQFAMVPMNLMSSGSADYVDTGSWSSKAIKEAKEHGTVQVIASSADDKYGHIPDPATLAANGDAAYLHVTSNNTIAGTQYHSWPTPPEGVPLVADMSSDIMSRVVDVSNFGLIYAGAQKNLGPSGVTLVIMDNALAERTPENLPTMFKYGTHIKGKSMYNTPPTFAIYILGLVAEWLQDQGGVSAIESVNEEKAAAIYGCIDQDDFYRGPAASGSRSWMNVCFTLPNSDLEARFIEEAKAAGMVGLKGHRSVGGMRASIYNAMPLSGVQTLVSFMNTFRQQHG